MICLSLRVSVVLALLLVASTIALPASAQSIAPATQYKPAPPPQPSKVAPPPLDCTTLTAAGQDFCRAYNVAIVECAHTIARADRRQCLHARLPAPPPPEHPKSALLDSKAEAAANALQARYATCTGRRGDDHLACMRAGMPDGAPASNAIAPPAELPALPAVARGQAAEQRPAHVPWLGRERISPPAPPTQR